MRDLSKKRRVPAGLFCLLAGTLVPALTMFIGFIIIKVWPFGDGTVLIIDSLHQYLPFYTDFHEKLVHGESLLYSFSGGFGYDFWSTYAYYFASPFNFLIALVPTPNVGDFMDLMILIKVSLCGGIFAWYLNRRQPSRLFDPIVFGTMYAMGNFLIGYYFNLMWLDSIAVLPLIMFGIEKLVKGESGRVYGISLFYALWCNYYIGFMLCIFSCLYLMVCFSEREALGLKDFLKRCVTFAWYSLLAGGMASAVLLPAYISLSSSESMQSNSFPTTVKFYTDIVEMLYAHFIAEHPINISDSQVGLNAYCGVSVLILVLLYALDRKISWRKKAGRLALAGLLLLSFSMNILNYIWHGFHTQNGLPNRFAFLYIVIILTMCFDVLPHIGGMSVPALLIGCVPPVVFAFAACLMKALDFDTYGNWNYLTPILLTVYAVLILVIRILHGSKTAVHGQAGAAVYEGAEGSSTSAYERPEGAAFGQAGYKIACIMLSAVMLAEAIAHGIYGIEYNENVTRSIYLEDQASFKELVGRTGDTDFFRSEIDRTRMRNVGIFSGAHSIVMFNSTMAESVTEFCDRIGMEARTNKNGYVGVTRLMNDVFGIRYLLSPKGKGDTLYGFEKIDEDDNLILYKNENALSLGFMVNPELRYWDTDGASGIDVQNDFVNLATGMDDLYVLDRTIDAKDGEENGILVPENKQVYIDLPARVAEIKVDTPEYSDTYKTYTDHMYVINSLGDNNLANITCTLKSGQNSAVVNVYTCSNEACDKVVEVLARDQMKNVMAEGNRLSGDVDASEDGILLLTIPYDKDWKVTVDGGKAEALEIGSMFMGLELPAGSHQIAMKYEPGGLKAGIILSLLCACLLFATLFFEEKRKKKRKEEKRDMKLTFSRKAESFKAGIFSILNDRKEELLAQGRRIFNLSVGTPDFKVPEAVRKAVSQAALDPDNYKYSLVDIPELKAALQDYYQKRYSVRLEADEMMSVYGSQEGMAHIAWALCDPGDTVLVPNPGYPIFKIGPELCGADVWEYPLTEENGYLPKLDEIPEEVRRKARFMVVNYPGNPLCKAAPDSFYKDLIAFAKENDIIIIHDNAYSDIIYGGRTGKSFLSFAGAKEVGAEFYSLSKTFDYTGARMSFLVGNAQIIEKFRTIRSQIDYGIFLPVQYGAIAALREPEDAVLLQCEEYERRMQTLCGGLRSIGWDCPDSEGTMFVWAPLPKGYTNSEEFVLTLMEKTGVICTPGSSFGSLGEGYVRFALVLPCEQLEEAVRAIKESGIIHP